MSHRAAMYIVRVRPKRDVDGWMLLGDVDSGGTWLGDLIDKALADLKGTSRDGKVEARFGGTLPGLGTSQVGATLISGRSGVVSLIEKPGEEPFHRTADHREAMRSAVLFDLPPNLEAGSMAIHIPHGHGCKAIVEDQLRSTLGKEGYVLDLGPVVPQSALLEAVKQNGVEQVTLIKHDPLASDRFSDAAMWGRDEVDRLELKIPSKRKRRLRADPVTRFLEDSSEANRRRIIEFQGLTFDEVTVTVELLDGSTRTFYLEQRQGGHPMTTALTISASEADELGAVPGALSRELQRALASVSPPS